jgi:hypothetical protein
MPTMTAIWTALPNGLTGDPANRRARLSVYISMRLTTDTGEDGKLADFPAALTWPSLLQPGAFTISVQGAGEGGSSVTASVVSAPPELALWQDFILSDDSGHFASAGRSYRSADQYLPGSRAP